MNAQSAIELLSTYSWAFVVVILVGGALYARGVFNPSGLTGPRVTGFTIVHVDDHKLDTNGSLTLVLGNKAAKRVNLTGVSVSVMGVESAACELECGVLDPNTECLLVLHDLPKLGERVGFTAELVINYTETQTGSSHSDFGVITGTVEPA